MGIFSKTNQIIKSEDYDRLSNKITDIASALKVIETQIEVMKTNINSINGRINRNKQEEQQPQDIKNGLPFPFQGGGLS